jgi:hypothetical protein
MYFTARGEKPTSRGFYPRAARYIMYPLYFPDERDMHMHVNFGVIRVSSNTRQRLLTCV